MSAITAFQDPFPDFAADPSGDKLRGDSKTPAGLPLRDTPAYRAGYSPDACSTQELLAAVIRGPKNLTSACRLLADFRNLQEISHADPGELMRIPGIGTARAASIKAALELGRRLSMPAESAPGIQSPQDAAAILIPKLGHLEKERLMVLALNTRNRLIGEPIEVYNGSLNSSTVRVGEVFRPALRANAAAIIIAQNHPSGDATPSPVIWRKRVKRGNWAHLSI